MEKNKILIITNTDDPHVDNLIDIANKNSLSDSIIRLNTNNLLTNCIVDFHTETEFNIEIIDSKKTVNSKEIKSVWYRRPTAFDTSHLQNKDIETFVNTQTENFLYGLYIVLERKANFINPIFETRKASYKIPQLLLAKQIGLKIPTSIISNNKYSISNFSGKHEEISTKSNGRPNFFYNRTNYPIFNRKVDKSEIETNIETFKYCPTFFQEYISKKYDVRIIVIGNKIYAFSIDSQANKFSIEDFRGCSPDLLKHKKINIPKDIEFKILEFIRIQDLKFSALDFVVDQNDNFIFIENNPNGQWLWLEYATQYPLTEKMLNYLLNPH